MRVTPAPGQVRAEVEDDFHHFGVIVSHAEGVITDVQAFAPYYPWVTCPGACDFLKTRAMGGKLSDILAEEDQRQHCTHLFDIFALAVAHAEKTDEVQYDVRIYYPEDGKQLAQLDINGVLTLQWLLGGDPETSDVPAGDLRAFGAWCRQLPDELEEPARMFRHVLLVGVGRHFDMAHINVAAEIGHGGVCYTFQPERADMAYKSDNPVRDFSDRPEDLLSRRTDDF